jgi:hypothetical protein
MVLRAAGPPQRARAAHRGRPLLRPGDRLDVWVIEKRLGSGGMGSVYRCHNHAAKRILAAIKVLDAPVARSAEARARFVREAEILFTIEHPNIVKVRNVRVDVDTPYIEMEFVEGESLEDRLSRRGPLPLDVALPLVAQLAGAVAFLHARGVRHRDIKPANFLIDKQGLGRLVDFGLAMESGTTRLTQGNMSFGTVSYAPPEWIDPQRLDPVQWDLYAIGVVLWEMLTGAVAFPVPGDGDARQQAFQVVLKKQGHPPLDPGPTFPDPVRALIRDLTAPTPEDRLPSAAALLERLSAIAEMPPRTLAPARPGHRAGPPPPPLTGATVLPVAPPAARAVADTWPTDAPSPRAAPVTALPIDAPSLPPLRRGGCVAGLAAMGALVLVGAAAVVGAWWAGALGLQASPEAPEAPPAATAPAPPRPVRLATSDLRPDLPVRIAVASADGRMEGRAWVSRALAPGSYTAVITVGACPDDLPPCEESCPPGCRRVARAFTVPSGDGPHAATLQVSAPTQAPSRPSTSTPPASRDPGPAGPTAPEPAESPAPTPEPQPEPAPKPQPEPPPRPEPEPPPPPRRAGRLVTAREYARWLTTNADWEPGNARARGLADDAYLFGWEGLAPPPSDADRPVQYVPHLAARAFCQGRGGLPQVDDPPTTWDEAAVGLGYEWRLQGDAPAILESSGTPSTMVRRGQALLGTGFRCVR